MRSSPRYTGHKGVTRGKRQQPSYQQVTCQMMMWGSGAAGTVQKHLLTSLTFDYLNWSRGSDQEPSVGFIDDCTVKEMLLKYKMKGYLCQYGQQTHLERVFVLTGNDDVSFHNFHTSNPGKFHRTLQSPFFLKDREKHLVDANDCGLSE